MPLKPGHYRILYVPSGLPPSDYAVSGQIEKPLPVSPLEANSRWELLVAPGNIKDQWTIRKEVVIERTPDYIGWGRPSRKGVHSDDRNPFDFNPEIRADKEAEREGLIQWPDQPVIYTTLTQNWQITETPDGGGNPEKTYNIKIPTDIVGVISAVTIENNHLVTKNYPAHPVPGFPHKLPAWRFIPIV
ncbi:hypothetical protein H1R20_g2050, partial [Candolleomyces eurysporus]